MIRDHEKLVQEGIDPYEHKHKFLEGTDEVEEVSPEQEEEEEEEEEGIVFEKNDYTNYDMNDLNLNNEELDLNDNTTLKFYDDMKQKSNPTSSKCNLLLKFKIIIFRI